VSPGLASFLAVLVLVFGVAFSTMACGAREATGADDPSAEGSTDGEGQDGEDSGNEKAPIPVEVVEVGQGEISSYLSATANLVAENQVRVLSEAQGRVRQVLVEEGDFVQRGQALAYLAREDAQILLEKAKVRQNNAERAYERSRDLIDKELISREAYDETNLGWEVAQQELAEAEWQLQKTTIRSPFAGRISERMVQTGQHVTLNDELFQVTDFDPLVARIFLPEGDIIGLDEGLPVRLTLNADEDVVFDGDIRQISPIVDTSTGTVKVTIEVTDAPEVVRPGSFVGIHIVRETRSDATIVPMEAVIRELQNAHVFVVDDGVARKRTVELGLQEGARVEVLEGIAPGETLITAGQGGLKDSSPVKILDSSAG